MIAATYGPIEDIELLWVLIALVGVVYSTLNLRDALGDWRYVRDRRISNGRRILAKTYLISESLRLASLSIFAIIGVLAMSIETPQPPDLPPRVAVVQFLVRWGLLAASVMLVIKSYLAKKVRDELKVGGQSEVTTPQRTEGGES